MKPTNASTGHHRHHAPEEMHNDDVAHEHTDINIPALLWSAVMLAAVVGGTAVLMLLLFNFLEGQAKARDPQQSPLAMPATTMPLTTTASPFFGSAPDPKLMTGEPLRLEEVRRQEQQLLNGYGWVDEKAGLVRVPIDEAKTSILKSGLPVRPDPLTDESVGTQKPASGESSSGRNITRTLTAAAPAAAPPPPPAAPAHGTHKN